ncbi:MULTISPECIES: UGSC family (seleno)protein [unclassified Microbacterium]|uniref:UGSC family (seleno)protein n=1 Tax=unclassified Microbacterium TaxID=2609290 RepID=UPI00214AF4D0|nr:MULTISPECIES: UGSC family (seleno)protein [unclassified Microbacterium]MCR2808406.1 UGSC family (seleno)protein [Microbacterium sp. zg.B185]WIM19148.1 UGSC family (seleno)protein [Microbacterium sp. zg-B185]
MSFYEPCGFTESKDFSPAPRVGRLVGLSVGLLSNRKRNADRLLEFVAEILASQHGIASSIVDEKEAMSLPAPEAQLRSMAERVEALVVAVGDCGSCSATTVMDAIAAERFGLPAVPIVTEQFRSGAEMVASIQGADDFPIAYVEHPIATLDDDGLRERAQRAVDQVVAILTA